MKETKIAKEDNEFIEILKEVFWKGRTEMGALWLMFITGLVFGFLIKNCSLLK